MGQNGGAAFILIYLGFVLLAGLPVMLAEFIIGRRSQASARKAFLTLAPGSRWGIAGVQNGIEKFSKVMMPLLFLIVIGIAVRSMTLPGSGPGMSYLFKPDWSKVTSQTFLAALRQAFFSLSLGSCMVVTYASYVKKDANILSLSAQTAAADTVFALIAGCAIMPAVFAFGISPGEGPDLVFITLPHIFSQMPMGGVIAIFFFLALLLAAITSAISILR